MLERKLLNFKRNKYPKIFIKNLIENEQTKKIKMYPCLCQALTFLLDITRIMGILPLGVRCDKRYFSNCQFVVKRNWVFYSSLLQLCLFIYIVALYSHRIYWGPIANRNTSEWYVMTFGYIISDLEVLIIICSGCSTSSDVCQCLEDLMKIRGSISEGRKLKNALKWVLTTCLLTYLCVLTSYIYVAFLRYSKTLSPYMLDSPTIVILRGLLVLYPCMEMVVVFSLCFILSLKFQHLADICTICMKYLSNQHQETLIKNNAFDSASLNKSEDDNPDDYPYQIDDLEEMQKKLFACAYRVTGSAVSIPALATMTSSLYTTMYYLYRFSTATEAGFTSNTHERIHYAIGVLYRFAKLFGYMLLGRLVLNKSLRPLRVLEKSKIINLPFGLQQQIQTLMLQWSSSKCFVYAGGIIKIGPWLLAPITGSIITYLLVALQFKHDV